MKSQIVQFVVLKSYRGLASQDEGTEALYAEYIATDSIASDSLIQKAVKYYNKEISLESAQASYYLGCYYFSRDKNKAAYSFQISIDFTPDGNNNHKGRAYHALGSCLFANGNTDEGVKAYETALTLLDENENESTWQLFQDIKKTYGLCHSLRMIFSKNTIKDAARLSMARWYNKVEEAVLQHSMNTMTRY